MHLENLNKAGVVAQIDVNTLNDTSQPGLDVRIITVKDDVNARLSRISHFMEQVGEASISLNSLKLDDLLSKDEEIVCTLVCSKVESKYPILFNPMLTSSLIDSTVDIPASTDPCAVEGKIAVSIIRSPSGHDRIHFSMIEGTYRFRAHEEFFEQISKGLWQCCLCIKNKSDVTTDRFDVHYSTDVAVLSQDCSLPLKQSVYDALSFRRNLNSTEYVHSTEARSAQMKNQGYACLKCLYGCNTLCHIYCFGFYRCNPCCNPCCQCSMQCCSKCTKCCSWDCLFCVKKDYDAIMKKNTFVASEEYKFGVGPYVTTEFALPPPIEAPKDDMVVWEDFPCYFGPLGCCMLIQYRWPLPEEGGHRERYAARPPVYVFRQPKFKVDAANIAKEEEKTLELTKTDTADIIVAIHYKHVLTGLPVTCTLTLDTKESISRDDLHERARKFQYFILQNRELQTSAPDHHEFSVGRIGLGQAKSTNVAKSRTWDAWIGGK